MTRLQRRIFMFSFIFLFLIIAPIIIFFARGYRFDLEHGIFVYSGAITIKSWPGSVDIYLDGEKADKNLNYINNSYTINGVKPGKYTLSCEKDGYTSWKKNISVHSGISTEFWNVLLFPKKEIREESVFSEQNEKITQFFLSPRENDEVVFFSESKNNTARNVYLLNIDENEVEKIYSTSEYSFLDIEEGENIEWSSDNKKIFIPLKNDKDEKIYIIAKIREGELTDPINLSQVFNTEKKEPVLFKKVRWMFDKNEELVVLTKENKLYYINHEKPEEKILLDENVSGFDFAGDRIYYTQLPNNIVWEIKKDNKETKRQVTSQSFPTGENSSIELTVYDQYRLTIRDENTGGLFLYNKEKEKNEVFTKQEEGGVQGIQFSDDGKKLLYWTDSEIRFLMLRDWEVQPTRKKGQGFMITRFSTPIKNVQWMDNYENIIFTVGDKIKSAEIDLRDHVNIVDIVQAEKAFNGREVLYNKNNQVLLFLANGLEGESETNSLKSFRLLEDTGFLGIGGR